jgi:ribosomal protein S27AE
VADEFDRAQENEERDRAIALQEQRSRAATTARDTCDDCGADLAEHRKRYGRCVPCQTTREARAKQFRKV